MKKKVNIKTTIHSSFLFAICSLLIALCYLSCEQPFKAGLGGVIDLQAPVIVLESPGAGAFIRGTTEFIGRASDDYKLNSIWFQLSNYPDLELPEYKTMKHRTGTFHMIAVSDDRSCSWKFKINTRNFEDGDFKIKLLAIDSVGKEALTDDIAFFIKNKIPQISMSLPSIVPGSADGDLGGQHLNFNYIKDRPSSFRRALNSKGMMSGMISDSEGINRRTGEAEIMDESGNIKTAELFPPQIRFWQVDMAGARDPNAQPPVFPAGYLPTEAELKWEKLPLREIGVNDVLFTYDLPNVSGQYFGFEIRAQSSDRVHSVAEYPRSWIDFDGASDDFIKENSYVLIYVREPLEYPTLELYKLEDIHGPRGWNPAMGNEGGYNDINGSDENGNFHFFDNPGGITPLDRDGDYPFFDRPITNKNGPFTLRMKAYHSGGIASAAVFWEKDDKSAKGRFIWDPVNEIPFNGWRGDAPSGLNHFSNWGRRDPNIEGGSTVRGFVFTYNDDGKDIIPDTNDFYDGIRGRSKIQAYKKTAPGSDDKGKPFDFDELPEDMNYWEDVSRLPEGTYNISVYTTSLGGTRIAVPFTATISIDRKEPELKLNYIEGGAGEELPENLGEDVTVVNGVIRPRFILSDEGTGFRTATRLSGNYFMRPKADPSEPDRFYPEQAYVLVYAGDINDPQIKAKAGELKQKMDAYLKTNAWPKFPQELNGALAIDGVTVSKHGPIIDSSCLFKTSRIYAENVVPPETGVLADGLYWLYAFGRDNAFNVGRVSFPVEIRLSSDDPVFEFSNPVNPDVTEADSSFDTPKDNTGKSFIIKEGVRNKFSANSAIRVKLKDDDSLDLGVGGINAGDSMIKVSFIGSTVVNEETVAYDDKKFTDANPSDTNTYLMKLTDVEIKSIFPPQTTYVEDSKTLRRPVREITGTISQNVLLKYLKENPAYDYLFGGKPESFNSLPDGIYRINITVSDFSPAKLRMPTDPNPADVITREKKFWIAVDSKNPTINTDSIEPKFGEFVAANDPLTLKGSVSDENGPITVKEWEVKDGKNPVTGPTLVTDPEYFTSKGYTGGKWNYEFAFPMNMNGKNGTFTFEVKFQDRFGNISTLSQRYSVDNVRPTVTLTREIETFQRNFPDVTLPGGGEVSSENKNRLAVKVVNFSLSVTDNNKVTGARWWLLPADKQPNAAGTGFETASSGGQVTDYNAFPAKKLADQPGVYYPDGTVPGFDTGAYGVVDVENRRFTIAVDTEKLLPKDGEYRLHIIAIDDAGNVSLLTESPAASNVFQTVFILQEEDKPYFSSSGVSKISPDGGMDAVIGETGLWVRGAIFENNGFFADSTGASIMTDSVRIWFNNNATLAANLPALGTPIATATAGYIGPITIPVSALGSQGRNLSLAFNLAGAGGFTSAQIGGDGLKSYIIEAADSPINKLKPDGSAAAAGDTSMRVSRWKAYSFMYDNNPPKIAVTNPLPPNNTFGTNFAEPGGFNLVGYIEDANLATKSDSAQNPPVVDNYYFEYFLDNITARKTWFLGTAFTAVGGDKRVNFNIPPADVAAKIIPDFDGIDEGPHTLTLIASDKSGKDSSFIVNFIKDKTPPEISFTNFIAGSTVYNAANKSKVADNWWTGRTPADKLAWLRANPLTIIYYDPGTKPILQGAIADAVSNINIPTFKYWIDNKAESSLATIDGSGRNVRWTIYLTSDGTVNGTPLPDGVHTIMLNVDDTSGAQNNGKHMIAFRIDSKPPTATITVPANSVFGKPDQQPDPVFTISGTASDANLEKLELRITDKASGAAVSINGNSVVTFNTASATYTPFPPEDIVLLNWSQPVTKAMYNLMGDGKSYDVKVVASDYYGNKSEEAVWTFTVDKSSPVIEFTNPTKTNATGSDSTLKPENFITLSNLGEAGNINRLSSENLRIQGKVTDAFSAIRDLESQVWKWNWSAGVWDVLEAWKEVQNLSANRLNEINWTKNLLGQNDGDLNIGTAGGASTPEGLYRIRLRAKDESFTQNGTANWTIATDRGNPVESAYLYFYYDRTNPELTIDGNMENFYSTRIMGGKFVFSGNVRDNNRFAKIEVKIEPVDSSDKYPSTPYSQTQTVNTPNLNIQAASSKTWSVTFDDNRAKPDGRYRVIATVYDMTGRSYSVTKAFTLDNTPPGAKFTLPAKVQNRGYGDDSENPRPAPPANNPTAANSFASVIVNGGEGAVITGETWDRSGNSSESGIDQMWFHLGFIDGSSAFPTRAAIEAEEIRIIRAFNPALTEAQVREMSPADRNAVMDTVSEYLAGNNTDGKGNAWFKLGGTEVPTGFIINNPNIYDWRMEIPATHPTLGQIGGLKLYGSDITVKDRKYYINPANTDPNRRMAQIVTGQAGIYRLPLWIRLVDKVGNVEYYCHDIWFYPDGDIPTTTIFGADNRPMNEARGGAISVDGEARSNTSVFHVAFRVFADGAGSAGKQGTNLNNAVDPVLPDAADVVTMPSALYEFVPINSPVYNIIDKAGYATTNLIGTSNSRWYYANLSLKGGAGEPLVPWSVILNSGEEISDLIKTKGFSSPRGEMIRVWLEVFVFNGEGSPIRSSIYQDDQLKTANNKLYGTAGAPKPYVRAFFITTAAPEITHPDVGGSWSNNAFVWNAPNQATADPATPGYKGAGTEVRRDKFAVRAILDPKGSRGSTYDLREVSIRTRLNNEPFSTWTTVWENGALLANNPGVKITARDVTPSQGSARTRYNFEYDIESRPPSGGTTAGFALLNNGNWANSGGNFTVQVRIRDTATPANEAEQTIVVGVDNFAPVADSNYVTNPKVAGTNVDFMGRVYDYATSPLADTMTDIAPRKIAKVYAWFTRTEGTQVRYVNINTGERRATLTGTGTDNKPLPGLRTMSVLEGRDATVTYGSNSDTINSITMKTRGTLNTNRQVPGLGSQAAHNADWVREISGSTAIPGTRMLWSPVNSADHDIRWSFNIDTTVLPDGKLTLHYVVEDAAGNASYYNQEISVRNKYPQIDRVTLITDNNGIGAVYTTHPDPNASTEYVLNNYRTQMFANITDPAYYTKPSDPPGRLDSLGYLNSGFISKNQYIGFKVESSYGNRNLNFRLQYVKRERIALTAEALNQMVADRNANDRTKINLYTIAWHGDYSNAKWKALGVPVDNPTLGTHFVFNPVNTSEPSKAFDVSAAIGTAEVWKYTAVKTRADITPSGQPTDDTVVFGPDNRFDFNRNNTQAEGQFTGITQSTGSQPDYRAGDKYQNDPRNTAFFLIRVWDSVNPPAVGSETYVNDQLYDAVVVGMNVYLSDDTNPTARLYDPNPYAETKVVGNNITTANQEQTVREALDPRGIGQNILRGGLYNVKNERELVKSGHIEPRNNTGALKPRVKNPVTRVYEPLIADGFVEGDSAANSVTGYTTLTKDLVSGKVILRGSAWDDQLIKEIRVNIGTGTTPPADLYSPSSANGQGMAILRLDLSGNKDSNPNYRTMQPVNGAKAWAAEELHWKTGHTVEWAYVWDTESKPNASGTPAENIRVWVAVIDQLGSGETGLASGNVTADNEANETFKNTLAFDIVPYITGIERDPAKFTTTRSLQGWYSFFRGEANVSIVGYNLKGSGNSTLAIRHSASATTAPTITGAQTINKITFTVPDNAQSGKIILNTTVPLPSSGTNAEALNHRSNDAQSWNKEYHSFTDGSALWINKPYAHIWRTTDSDTAPRTYMGSKTVSATSGSKGLDHPGMALEYTGTGAGTLHGTWAVYGYANSFYGVNNGTTAANSNNNLVAATPGEPYGTPDISIFNGGGRTAANIGYSYQGDGDARLFLKAVVTTPATSLSAGQYTMQAAGTAPTQRWQNVRISKAAANTSDTETNVGRIYMTAFDARYNSLWFGYAPRINDTTNYTFTIDGGTGGATNINANNSGLAAVASAGQFSAVDYDNVNINGTTEIRPIIAYYDQTNDTVRIALGMNTTPGTGNNQWNRKNVLPDGHPLFRGSGRYISIKVDKSNGIHLAFFNSVKSTIVYAYARNRDAAFTAYAVDDVVKGGTWTDISVDNSADSNGVPNAWIVYGDNSRTGNYDGVRMAYRSGPTTGIQFVRERKDSVSSTAATSVYITGWEAVSMPANYTINNDRLNIEAWPPTVRGGTLGTAPGWNAAIGYASDMYRIGYFYYPEYKDGNY